MPLLNGYEVLREIRSNGKLSGLPVIAITANAMPEDREKVMAAGFDSYVSKPVALAQLRAEVSRLLGAG
jgi:CheY-like chemotaxis protein